MQSCPLGFCDLAHVTHRRNPPNKAEWDDGRWGGPLSTAARSPTVPLSHGATKHRERAARETKEPKIQCYFISNNLGLNVKNKL